jgi:hypothetical protein
VICEARGWPSVRGARASSSAQIAFTTSMLRRSASPPTL